MDRRQRLIFNMKQRSLGYVDEHLMRKNIIGHKEFVQRMKLEAKLDVHRGCVNSVVWNESGDRLLSGSDDKTLCITNPFSRKKLVTIESGHKANIFSARFLANTGDQQVISCSGDGQLAFNEVEREDLYGTRMFTCHYGTAYEVKVVPTESHQFFSCGEDGTVRWYDLRRKTKCETDNCREDVLINCHRSVTCLSINPLIPYHLAIGCSDGSIRLFDRRMLGTRATGNYRGRGIHGMFARFQPEELQAKSQYCRPTSTVYSPDGQSVLVSYSSDYLYLFNWRDRREDKRFSTAQDGPSATPDPGSPKNKEQWKFGGESSSSGGGGGGGGGNPVKRLRLRGDWSDTGPKARPASERRAGGTSSNILQRLSGLFSRLLDDAAPGEGEGGEAREAGGAGGAESRNNPEGPGTENRGGQEEAATENPAGSRETPGGSENPPEAAVTVSSGGTAGETGGSESRTSHAASTVDHRNGSGPGARGDPSSSGEPSSGSGANDHSLADGAESQEQTRETGFPPTATTSATGGDAAVASGEAEGTPAGEAAFKQSSAATVVQHLDLHRTVDGGGHAEAAGGGVDASRAGTGDPSSSSSSSVGAGAGDALSAGGAHPGSQMDVEPAGAAAAAEEGALPGGSERKSKMKRKRDCKNSSASDGASDEGAASRGGAEGGGALRPPSKLRKKGAATLEGEQGSAGDSDSDQSSSDESSEVKGSGALAEKVADQSGGPEPAPTPAAAAPPPDFSGGRGELGGASPDHQPSTSSGWPPATEKEAEEAPSVTGDAAASQGGAEGGQPAAAAADLAATSESEAAENPQRERTEEERREERESSSSPELQWTCTVSITPCTSRPSRDSPVISTRVRHEEGDETRRGVITTTIRTYFSASDDSEGDSDDSDEPSTPTAVSRRLRENRRANRRTEEQSRSGTEPAENFLLREMFRHRREQKEDQGLKSVQMPPLKKIYKGHRNSRTMIKEANFFGDQFVISGSDCGHIFFWDKETTEVVMLLEGDKHVVNCVQPHPFDPLLATSGIDYDVKFWAPSGQRSPDTTNHYGEIMRINEVMLEETRDTMTVSPSVMLRMLARMSRLRSDRPQPEGREEPQPPPTANREENNNLAVAPATNPSTATSAEVATAATSGTTTASDLQPRLDPLQPTPGEPSAAALPEDSAPGAPGNQPAEVAAASQSASSERQAAEPGSQSAAAGRDWPGP